MDDPSKASVAIVAIIESANSLRLSKAPFDETWIQEHILQACNALLRPHQRALWCSGHRNHP
ncbi:hypothetical protein D3C75_1227500 [compost metagenome]